jgi:hypothetical protein
VDEAMAARRPCRAGPGIDAAPAEIEQSAGVRYHPDAARACWKLFREGGYQLPQ